MQDVLRYIDDQRERYLSELKEFLSIPSVSTRSEHRGDVRKAAEWVASQARGCGCEAVTIHETPGHPIITAHTPVKPGAPTVLVYGHYDVQPAEPLELWHTPPFQPEVREGKLFARGAADDKGQVFVHLKVLEALARSGGVPLNVKLLIEGEEEIGSPNLVPFLEQHVEALGCDVILVSDTHMLGVEIPSITTALRGLAALEISVQTAHGDMHSGTFGGAVANPIQVLATMLAACKDGQTGKILIPGFYDGVRALTDAERTAISRVPHDDVAYARSVGAPALFGEAGYSSLERTGARPTFEINGMWGGYIGEGVKTVLPCLAQAKITMRLVPDQDPDQIARLVEAHLLKIAPAWAKVTVKRERNQGWPTRVSPDFAAMTFAAEAVKEVFGKPPAFTLEGGSIPIVAEFKRVLKRDTILLGFGLPDDNLHAPNEKFDLRMLELGMKTTARFLLKYGAAR